MLKNLHPGWIAGAIALAIALWLMSGSEPQPESESIAEEAAPKLIKVRVEDSIAQSRIREARISARTAPIRSVVIRAEASGQVESITAERGDLLEGQAMILQLAERDRPSQLAKAQAQLKQRQLQYEAAQGLRKRGLQSPVDLATAKANLTAAEAESKRLADELAHTKVRAPFAGVLETRPVEVGHFVNVGDELGRLIQQDPFIVRGQVSEDVVPFLSRGQKGRAILANGQEREGVLRYVASQADEGSRSFEVELEVPNPDQRLIAGASAVLILPLEEVQVHIVEPASLTLDESGNFGIKTVDADDRVVFHSADLLQSREQKIWLGGLPQALRIITVGQGFAAVGDVVEPVN